MVDDGMVPTVREQNKHAHLYYINITVFDDQFLDAFRDLTVLTTSI